MLMHVIFNVTPYAKNVFKIDFPMCYWTAVLFSFWAAALAHPPDERSTMAACVDVLLALSRNTGEPG